MVKWSGAVQIVPRYDLMAAMQMRPELIGSQEARESDGDRDEPIRRAEIRRRNVLPRQKFTCDIDVRQGIARTRGHVAPARSLC